MTQALELARIMLQAEFIMLCIDKSSNLLTSSAKDLLKDKNATINEILELTKVLREYREDMAQANEAYKAQQDKIKSEVAEISRLLKQHENEANEKVELGYPIGGFVGDLEYVNERLSEIIQFLK